MSVQNNRQQGFNLGGNGAGLILPSPPPSLILPEHGLQSQGLVTHAGDEQALIIQQEAKATNKTTPEPYFQVNGIFVPGNTETARAIQIVKAGDANIRYGQQEKPSFSFEEVLHNDLGKIIKLEADNTSIEDIKAYFGRLEDLSQPYKKDRGILMHNKASLAPLVMNRETFKEETYYPLKEFSLNSNSLEQLQNIVLKSLKMEDESKSSSAKRFALRFLTNTVFIRNFKSEKITEAVIQGLKTDREPAAKKIYEHYLTTQLGNLEPSQKKEIIDALNKNSRLSSHLAQSLFLAEPSLKEGIEIKEFPLVNNFEDLKEILDKLHIYSRIAMNQVNLLPHQINPDENYGIEIELKLTGANGYRGDKSPIQESLKPYAGLIELGTDFGGAISEMRTLSGGFKLDKTNQRELFEIVNIFHQSPDLVLFLSQHIHVDIGSNHPSSAPLLILKPNSNGVTLETKALDLNTMQLNPNNNLVYSYQVPDLIDQMIILEDLKELKPSGDIIFKSFELNEKCGISLSMAQVMLAAVESDKGYLIPNLLRLNSEGKNYLETNYLAEDEVALLKHLIRCDTNDVLKVLFDKIPKAKLEEVLTCVDQYGRNALMLAIERGNQETVELVISEIPEAKLEEALTCVDQYGSNALMLAIERGNQETVELV
ncbi:MAG: hypothetical protein EBR67_10445, partial [Proteobacteria bacterium]|nr:hypothetical protein [Pseudomonadota bacterium]